MKSKKKIRENFRNSVFNRDNYTCQKCDAKNIPMDAHHITDRNEMPNGGYVVENGITLCKEKCHMKAELFHISNHTEWEDGFHPDDLYKKIGSSYKKAFENSLLLI